jgi:hypothetical protein
MARPPSPYRKTLVEECEVISVSTAMGNLAINGISFEYTRGGRGGWFGCSFYSGNFAERLKRFRHLSYGVEDLCDGERNTNTHCSAHY